MPALSSFGSPLMNRAKTAGCAFIDLNQGEAGRLRQHIEKD
jgi:hypothetical protein